MNTEILFNTIITESTGSILKITKYNKGIMFTIGNVDIFDKKNESEHDYFIKTERLDEFIGMLNYIKSTL